MGDAMPTQIDVFDALTECREAHGIDHCRAVLRHFNGLDERGLINLEGMHPQYFAGAIVALRGSPTLHELEAAARSYPTYGKADEPSVTVPHKDMAIKDGQIAIVEPTGREGQHPLRFQRPR